MSEVEKRLSVCIKTDKAEHAIGERVRVFLEVLNFGRKPVKLNFNSAQRYEFIVLKEDQEVWHWSNNKMFAMVLGSLVLKPNEKERYTEALETAGMAPGNYDLVGIITSRPQLKATCKFTIKPL